MLNNYIKPLLALVLYLSVSATVAQAKAPAKNSGKETFIDLFINQKLECRDTAETIFNEKLNRDEQIRVIYSTLRFRDTSNFDVINNHIRQIAINTLKTDAFYTQMLSAIPPDSATTPGRVYTPQLESVQCKVVAFGVGVACLKFNYNEALYKPGSKKTASITNLFYYNNATGKIYPSAQVFAPAAEAKLTQLLAARLEQYKKEKHLTLDVPPTRLSQGYLIPLTPSWAFRVPVSSNELAAEQFIDLYFSPDELTPYLNHDGPFASLPAVASDSLSERQTLNDNLIDGMFFLNGQFHLLKLDSLFYKPGQKNITLNKWHVNIETPGENLASTKVLHYDENGFLQTIQENKNTMEGAFQNTTHIYYQNSNLIHAGTFNPGNYVGIAFGENSKLTKINSGVYDAHGRVIEAKIGFPMQFSYDEKGQLRQTIANGHIFLTYEYNDSGRIAHITQKDYQYHISCLRYDFGYEYYEPK